MISQFAGGVSCLPYRTGIIGVLPQHPGSVDLNSSSAACMASPSAPETFPQLLKTLLDLHDRQQNTGLTLGSTGLSLGCGQVWALVCLVVFFTLFFYL